MLGATEKDYDSRVGDTVSAYIQVMMRGVSVMLSVINYVDEDVIMLAMRTVGVLVRGNWVINSGETFGRVTGERKPMGSDAKQNY